MLSMGNIWGQTAFSIHGPERNSQWAGINEILPYEHDFFNPLFFVNTPPFKLCQFGIELISIEWSQRHISFIFIQVPRQRP